MPFFRRHVLEGREKVMNDEVYVAKAWTAPTGVIKLIATISELGSELVKFDGILAGILRPNRAIIGG